MSESLSLRYQSLSGRKDSGVPHGRPAKGSGNSVEDRGGHAAGVDGPG